jgi:ATP-dependent DNA helicase RecQ
MLEQYPVDLRGIAERVKLPVTTVDNALKALALDGALSLSDGARNPSRVMMRADHRDVHRLRLENARLGPLVECLLRLHGGLFEEAAMIDEGRLAAQLKWTVKRVGEGLRELQHLGLLFYRPRTDLPTATLLVPRRDAALLMLGHAALDGRRERAEQRLEAMLAYAADARTCRMRLLLAYFGEAPERDCGVCDTCRRAQRNATGPEGMRDEEAVRRERWQRDEDPHASA